MTTKAVLLGVVGVAVAGCGHFGKHEAMTPVRDASAAAAAPVTTSSVSPVDSTEAKKAFCDVYAQEIRKTEDTAKRFAAASAGDEQHPQTNWDDPGHWLSDAAHYASIIFGYAGDVLQSQITSSLPTELGEKARKLVSSMSKLYDLFAAHSAVADLKAESTGEYGPIANDVDKLCGAV